MASLSPRTAAKTTALRLLMVWLPLSLVIGLSVWLYEREHLEHRVLEDAIRDAQAVKPVELERYYRNEIDLFGLHQVVKLVLGEFVSVELYDNTGREIVQELTERASQVSNSLWRRTESTKLTDQPFYDLIDHPEQMAIITVVPIRDDRQEILGYIKGIYIVPDSTLNGMRKDSWGAVVLAIAAVMATLLIVFPIILYMQREHAAQTLRVLEGNLSLLEVLGNAVAHRDSDTDAHNYRVTLYALRLAEKLGLDENLMRIMIVGAFLHDVGKIGISDSILLKRGKLTAEEFSVMKTHVAIGTEIVRRSPWLTDAASIVESHHEKFDGSGYPAGLKGEQIPIEARVFAVSDVFDALTSLRPYKQPLPLDTALDIMRKDSGSHFDPKVLECFLSIAHRLYEEISALSHEDMRLTLQSQVQRYLME